MNKATHQKIAFMDTNALHFMYQYLILAEKEELYPFPPNENAATGAHNYLRNKVEEKNLKESLEKALLAIEFILRKDIQLEYSSVSELELMTGRAKGRAIQKAAKEGIPDRMLSKFFEEAINVRLSIDDLADIRSGVEKISDMLKRAGIRATVSNADDTRSILDLAKSIVGLVYLEFADSVIYANALIVKADYLITGDSPLRNTINRIKTGRGPYVEKRRLLKDAIKQVTLDKPTNATLPTALPMSKKML